MNRAVRRICEAGDAAIVLELGDASAQPAASAYDVDLNREAIAIAGGLRARPLPGVRDVVSAYRSVAIYFDPLTADPGDLSEALLSSMASASESGRCIDVPVVYGGEAGPDLEEVAAFAGCDIGTVIARHTTRPYRVFMLGFQPGFPYMAAVDDAIAAPRKATPRVRVAAGSVGIAGHQTGIYPTESPGGWQIIGRTAVTLFDHTRTPPAFLAPGDTVRFVPVVDGTQVRSQKSEVTRHKEGGEGITVLKPGLLTTVQDGGRWGHQHLGVPPAGPMDALSHRLANRLAGNADDAAGLEVTLMGPELRLDQPVTLAIAGADLSARIDGARVAPGGSVECGPGMHLEFGARTSGGRAYVAFAGGIDVPPVLGSRATHVPSAMGGLEGRVLRAGDALHVGRPLSPLDKLGVTLSTVEGAGSTRQLASGGARLRVMRGPQADCFDDAAFDLLERSRFVISPQSNRMGYRLTGARVAIASRTEMVSSATFTGALQVPPSGDPILLMADRQTSGGYPQMAVIITADLPAAGQLLPGDWVEFERCSRATAIDALRAQHHDHDGQ